MFEREVKVLKTMQAYADTLLSDLKPVEMCLQPTPGGNHAAWIVGHLAVAADTHSQYAGAARRLESWDPLFGMGSSPTSLPEDYPSKNDLIGGWHQANERIATAAQGADPALLGRPTQGPLAATLPTVADFLAFSMTGHTATHLGQLSAWRRAIGRPPLF